MVKEKLYFSCREPGHNQSNCLTYQGQELTGNGNDKPKGMHT